MRKKFLNLVYPICGIGSVSLGFWYLQRKVVESTLSDDNRGKFVLPISEHVKYLCDLSLKDGNNCRNVVERFTDADWCSMIIEDPHNLFRYFEPTLEWNNSKEDIFSMISKLDVDGHWLSALHWYLANICTDEDLYCQETTPFTRKSAERYEKFIKILRVLLFKSEFDSCDSLMDQNVLPILYRTLEEFRYLNSEITILTLKIISNIAEKSRKGAEQISRSSLLKTLYEMVHSPVTEVESILAHKICVNALHSIGVPGTYRLVSSIYELHRPPLDAAPVMDIVFVHGFRGTAFRTWRQRDRKNTATIQFWPKQWLAKDIPQPVRILAVDYPTKLLKIGTVLETISARSEKFQRAFEAAGVGDRPVVFVCHSMGGLLVKHMLINNDNLSKKTVGVLFMSTPHLGSPVAAYSYKFLRPSDDLRLLREDSEINQTLNTDFKHVQENIPIFVTVLESKKTPIFGTKHFIVPHISGVFDSGSVYHVDEHHHHVCKPEDRDSATYRIVLNFVKDALRHIKMYNL